MKMGQAIAMLVFTSVISAFTIDNDGEAYVKPFGYRLTAIIAVVCCLIGAVLFFFYNEKSVMDKIKAHSKEADNEDSPNAEAELLSIEEQSAKQEQTAEQPAEQEQKAEQPESI